MLDPLKVFHGALSHEVSEKQEIRGRYIPLHHRATAKDWRFDQA